MSIPVFINYEFKRRNIEILHLDTDLQHLTSWLKDKDAFTSHLHRVIFTIDGYGKDDRDLSKVPEVVAFFNELHKRWPYFLNFCFPNPSMYAWWFRIFFSNWPIPDNERKKLYHIELSYLLMADWFINADEKIRELDIPKEFYTPRQKEMIESIQSALLHNRI